MGRDPNSLLAEALALPVSVRAKLAAELLRSLDDENEDEAFDQAEYEAAWGEEIARRMKELDEGTVRAIPWDEARRRILADDDDASKR